MFLLNLFHMKNTINPLPPPFIFMNPLPPISKEKLGTSFKQTNLSRQNCQLLCAIGSLSGLLNG